MEKTPSMAARLRQRRLCLEMIRHLLMTYLFGDETEEEKKVAEGRHQEAQREKTGFSWLRYQEAHDHPPSSNDKS
ncbi:BnaC08g02660D [Brassica napus]|uniref:BnaC08g02660D protein n=1 Tax=Brassica napus TaxID=3708 RepID=A0A078H5U2_BRANA|nr:BnaC08g02660D [Brassica napus]